jgi:iron(III) transport system ATP-binding protein
MAGVEITRLSKRFESKAVLEDLNLRVGEGELVTLLGPSGCGKTTTLRCVAGLERPDGGEIRIGDRLVASPEARVMVAPNHRGVGMVFQSYALWPHMTVFANVAYPLRVRRRDRQAIRRQVMEVLAAVGMEAYAQRSVTALSGGQQQRVALARAIVAHPQVLLFDEPLSNLDAKLRAAMRREIRAVHERSGAASIYVTHDQEEAITLSDRVVVLDQGVVQQVGTPKDLYRRPANRFVADFLGFENLLAAQVVDNGAGHIAVRLQDAPGRLLASARRTHHVGERVELALRADELSCEAAPRDELSPSQGVLGTLVSCLEVGDRLERIVEVAGQRVVVRSSALEEGGDPLRPGDVVLVRVPPGRAAVLEPGPGADREATAASDAAARRGLALESQR